MLNIIYILLLIIIFIYISPVIDHFATDYDPTKSQIEIIMECSIQLIIIGLIVYGLYILNESKHVRNMVKLNKYDRLLIDLIFTIVFICTQSNLSKKLDHITRLHPVRDLFI